MKVLFLSVSIPPFPESQTIRNAYLLRALAASGCDVSVVTGACEGGDQSLVDLLPPGISIHRTRSPLYEVVQRQVAAVPFRRARSLLRSGIAVASGKVAAPDVRFDWAGTAYRYVRGHPELRPDVLVSSAGSYTAHMAAGRLAREWRLPWVAEYGDPWSFNPLRPASLPHIRWMNTRLERRALRHCSGLTVTTDETAKRYTEWLAPRELPVHVLTCGFDDSDFAAPVQPASDPEKVIISYVGTASRQQRSLRPTFQALAALRERDPAAFAKIELRVIGSSPLAFELHAASMGLDNVRFTGPVTYRESVGAIRASDILLLVGNQGQLQIPLKAFMYAGSGKPILFLGQLAGVTDPTWALLDGLGGARYAQNDASEIIAVLGEMITCRPQLEAEAWARRNKAQLEAYRWSVIGERFAEVVRTARPSTARQP